MSLNYSQLFKQMAKQPQVQEASRKKAEQVKKYIELRWPEVNELSSRDKAFLHEGGDVVKNHPCYSRHEPPYACSDCASPWCCF